MRITNQVVASKLSAYLQFRIKLPQLVDWAENAIMEGEFGGKNSHALAEVVGRIGLADVREFGLTWEDCSGILNALGYTAHVDIIGANQRPLGSSYWREKAAHYDTHGGVSTKKAAANKDHYYVERRPDGYYAGIRGGAERAGFTGPTQESVITQIQRSKPDAPIHVERVRDTDRGGRDKWRSA